MAVIPLPSEWVDAAAFRWRGGEGGFLVDLRLPENIEAPDDLTAQLFCAFFTVPTWNEVRELTEGILLRLSYATDLRSIVFHGPEGGASTNTVALSIEDGSEDELHLAQLLFDKLALRWLSTLRNGAIESADPATTAPWWPGWLEQIASIEARA